MSVPEQSRQFDLHHSLPADSDERTFVGSTGIRKRKETAR